METIKCENCADECSVHTIYFFGRPQDGVHLCLDCFLDVIDQVSLDMKEEGCAIFPTRSEMKYPTINFKGK